MTVIDDNKTQLNLTYLAIHRTFCLKRCIKKFYATRFSKEKNFPSFNILNKADWEELAIFKDLLDLFYQLFIQLQGNDKIKIHGAAWKSLVCINIIKEHLQWAKTEYIRSRNSGFLVTAIDTTLNLA